MIIYTFLISLVNTLSAHTLLTRKRSNTYCVAAFILNTFIVYCAAYLVDKYIGNPVAVKYALAFIAFLYIGYIYLVFSESITKKIFTMFSVWIFSLITLFLAISVMELFSNITVKYLQTISYLFRLMIQILFLLTSYFWLSKPYKRVIGIVSNKTISFMSLYLFLAFLLLINNYETSFASLRNFNSVYDLLLLLGFIILGYGIVFASISSSSKAISLKYDYKIVENQVELQRQNYKILNESINRLYALKHDVRHHISAIETMVGQQKYKEALEYIEQFNQNQQSKTLPILCDNFAADSIIKYYMSLAISKNIAIKANLIIPEDISINSLDLCVVLGNCLENAIEACDKLSVGSEKSIELTSKMVGTHIIFMISNSFNGQIVEINHRIKSSKGGPSHGIGLSNISETVNKYNGNLDIKYSENKFDITIIMCTRTLVANI